MSARIRLADLPEDLRKKYAADGKRSKYGSRITEVDGVKFSSKKEAEYYGNLRLLERAGKIALLRRQVPFQCWQNGKLVFTYFADACFLDLKTCRMVVADVKSPPTRRKETYRLKRRFMLSEGIEITEV